MNSKTYTLLVQFQKKIKKKSKRCNVDTPNAQIHDLSLSWVDTVTSLVLWVYTLYNQLWYDSFIGCVNNAVIKPSIYRNSYLCEQLRTSLICDFMYLYMFVVYTNSLTSMKYFLDININLWCMCRLLNKKNLELPKC